MRAVTTVVALCLLMVTTPVLTGSRSDSLDEEHSPSASSAFGCSPLSGGMDTLPMTARIVIDDTGFGEPFVVRLSSAGQLPTQIQRAPQVGGTIDTEIVQLELRGHHPRVGTLILRESATQPSLGQIKDVALDGGCQLISGEAHFDAFFELEVQDVAETWIHPGAVRLESSLVGPLTATSRWEVAQPVAQLLEEQGTLSTRGDLIYVELEGDPQYPEPGELCSEVFFTADVQIAGEAGPAELLGFGSSTLEFGAIDPGGTCNLGGGPCTSNSECNILDSCRRPSLATELTELPIGGFDLQLGSWSIDVRPVVGNSDCCEAHPTGGCSDSTCEALICSIDSFCCSDEWDGLCEGLALAEPICEATCFDPLATPSNGSVASSLLDQTYPATRSAGLYLTLGTQNFGELHNTQPINVQPVATVTNIPSDPMTQLLQGAGSVSLLSGGGAAVGTISNLVSRIEETVDCDPPPAGTLLCRNVELQLQGDFPGCPAEALTLVGLQRLYRDNPRPGIGFGQTTIDTLAVESQWDAVGSCLGALTVRLAPQSASTGGVSSLTPEEFFPAVSSLDLHLEFEAGAQLWNSAPLHVETTTDRLPSPDGERFIGDSLPVDLLDPKAAIVGQLTQATLKLGAPLACPADAGSYITFSSTDDLDLRGLGGGAGADYQILKGTLSSLHSAAGSLASAGCIDGLAADFNDPATPSSGQAFYYVARDGFGPTYEDWDSGGASQVGDRDATAVSCP